MKRMIFVAGGLVAGTMLAGLMAGPAAAVARGAALDNRATTSASLNGSGSLDSHQSWWKDLYPGDDA